MSPGIVKQVIPVVEQLTPIYLDIANGAQARISLYLIHFSIHFFFGQ